MRFGHIAALAVDVNMPKEVHWLYPSKGFVLYCTEKSIKEPTNPVWQLATCTWNLCKNRNMSKALIVRHYSRWMPIYVPELSRFGGSVPDLA